MFAYLFLESAELRSTQEIIFRPEVRSGWSIEGIRRTWDFSLKRPAWKYGYWVACSSGRDLELPELALGPSKNGEHGHPIVRVRKHFTCPYADI